MDQERPASTFRSLLPFTTTAPVRDAPYVNSLPRQSPYREFAARLDECDRDPSKMPDWGTMKPADVLHDADSLTLPRNHDFIRGKDAKIQPVVMQGVMGYASAMLLYDTLVRVTGQPPMNGSVLKIPRQGGWIGRVGKDKAKRNKVIQSLNEVKSLAATFISNCSASSVIRSTPAALSVPLGLNSVERTLSLADEILLNGHLSEAFAYSKNIAVIAFNIRVMSNAPGFLQIPDNVQDLNIPVTSSSLLEVMTPANVRHLRQAFFLAATISPLVVLIPFDLTKLPVCVEETLLNSKRLGNQKPSGIRKLEDELWTEILAVAEGKKTAFSAMMSLKEVLSGKGGVAHLGPVDLAFFNGDIEAYNPDMSIYDAKPTQPVSRRWPCPPFMEQMLASQAAYERALLEGPARLPEMEPKPPATPTNPAATNSLDPPATSMNPAATPTNPTTTPTDPAATSTDPAATPTNPTATPTNPTATPTSSLDPPATSTNPAATPTSSLDPLATLTDPAATPNPPATSTNPAATPTSSLDPPATLTDPAATPTSSLDPPAMLTDPPNPPATPPTRPTGGLEPPPSSPLTPPPSSPSPKPAENPAPDSTNPASELVNSDTESMNPPDPPATPTNPGDPPATPPARPTGELEPSLGSPLTPPPPSPSPKPQQRPVHSKKPSVRQSQQPHKPTPPFSNYQSKRRNGMKKSAGTVDTESSDGGDPDGEAESEKVVKLKPRKLWKRSTRMIYTESSSDGGDSDAGRDSDAGWDSDAGRDSNAGQDLDAEQGSGAGWDSEAEASDDLEVIGYDDLKDADEDVLRGLRDELAVKLEVTEDILPMLNGDGVKARLDTETPPGTWYTDTLPFPPVWVVRDSNNEACNVPINIMLEEDLKSFQAAYNAAATQIESCEDGGSAPPGVPCFNYYDFDAMSVQEVQTALANGPFVVADTPEPLWEFDLHGLQTVGDLDMPTDWHDDSIPMDDNHLVRLKRATLQQVHHSYKTTKPRPKPLNGLSFPRHHAAIPDAPFATDARAVQRTRYDNGCLKFVPPGEVEFGLVATAGALHYTHFDAHGECTWVRLVSGAKLWWFLEPEDPRTLSSTGLWTDPDLDTRNWNFNGWKVRVVLLRPGDLLVMPACTLHMVLTIEAAICHGGYFLATSCMDRTVFGAVHTLFESRVATNTAHEMFQPRMNSICAYFYKCFVLGSYQEKLEMGYLPNLKNEEDLKKLLIFACYIELQNALTEDSYSPTSDPRLLAGLAAKGINPVHAISMYSITAVSYEARLQNAYSRARMTAILKSVFSTVLVLDSSGVLQDPWDFLFIPALSWFLYSLRTYWHRSNDIPIDSAQENVLFPYDLLDQQIKWISSRYAECGLKHALNELDRHMPPVDNIVCNWPAFTVQSVASPAVDEEPRSFEQLVSEGCNGGDMLYFSARAFFSQGLKRKLEDGSIDEEERVWITTKELKEITKKQKID